MGDYSAKRNGVRKQMINQSNNNQSNNNQSNNNMSEKERNDKNNAKTVQAAAKAAEHSGNPYAMAAGKAINMADKISGGKASEKLGKELTKINNKIDKTTPNFMPKAQDLSNKMSESGMNDKIGQASDLSSMGSGGKSGSSGGDGLSSIGKSGGSKLASKNKSQKSDFKGEATGSINSGIDIKKAAIFVVPFLILFILFGGISMVTESEDSEYEDAYGAAITSGELNEYYAGASSKEAQKFYDRLNEVKLDYQSKGKSVSVVRIIAVYHIISSYNTSIGYDDMTTNKIEDIADAMFEDNTYSEDVFKENLTNDIFKEYFPKYTQEDREKLTKEVFQYIENYNEYVTIGSKGTCAALGSCSYKIKGFYFHGGIGNYTLSEELNVTDLKVRLMQSGVANGHNYGGTFGQPLANEDLVPFEKYLLGVAYQEIGPSAPDEAIKAQIVAARSYTLARPFGMGGWHTFKEESPGNWVVQMANSTCDQVYCDPDQGCHASNGQWSEIHSGYVANAGFSRDAMPEDSKVRTLATEVMGEVLVNDKDNIISTGYLDTDQRKFSELARNGYDYKQILMEVYNRGVTGRPYGAANIKRMDCNKNGSTNCSSNASTGPFASWKQYEGSWINIQLGNGGKTIHQIGCLVTSVSMLIAKSGVKTNIDDFNPGTFVQFLNRNGGFVGGGCFVWESVTKAAPTFKYVGKVYLSGYSKQAKYNKIKELQDQGYYLVLEVKGNTGQHWVAVDTLANGDITMMDPGSSATNLWQQYPWQNTSTIAYFKVEG